MYGTRADMKTGTGAFWKAGYNAVWAIDSQAPHHSRRIQGEGIKLGGGRDRGVGNRTRKASSTSNTETPGKTSWCFCPSSPRRRQKIGIDTYMNSNTS